MITSLQPLFIQYLGVRKYNLSDLLNETLILGLENEYVSGHAVYSMIFLGKTAR